MKNINMQLIDPFTFEYYKVYPGGNDAVTIILNKIKPDEFVISKLLTLFFRISMGNKEEDKLEFINLVNMTGAIHIYEKFSELIKLEKDTILLLPYAYDFSRELVTSCVEIESVKLGIILLGILDCDDEEKELIVDLAYDEEYTYYCLNSIISLFDKYDNIIWDIARYTYGWGRIHCIQNLKNVNNRDIEKWLLFKGYNNNINVNFTLVDCVLAGKLESLLLYDNVSKKVFAHSTTLIKLVLLNYKSNYKSMDLDNVNLFRLLAHYLKHCFNYIASVDDQFLKNIYNEICSDPYSYNLDIHESVIIKGALSSLNSMKCKASLPNYSDEYLHSAVSVYTNKALNMSYNTLLYGVLGCSICALKLKHPSMLYCKELSNYFLTSNLCLKHRNLKNRFNSYGVNSNKLNLIGIYLDIQYLMSNSDVKEKIEFLILYKLILQSL